MRSGRDPPRALRVVLLGLAALALLALAGALLAGVLRTGPDHGATLTFLVDPDASAPARDVTAADLDALPGNLRQVLERARREGGANVTLGAQDAETVLAALDFHGLSVRHGQARVRYEGVVFSYSARGA